MIWLNLRQLIGASMILMRPVVMMMMMMIVVVVVVIDDLTGDWHAALKRYMERRRWGW
jgi:hypothetical protein